MLRIELTREEMMSLMAHSETMKNLQIQLQPLLDLYNRHAEQQEKIVARIRKRIKNLPKTPLAKWNFSQVDPITYEGAVEVPEEEKK